MDIKDHTLPDSKDFGFINIGLDHDEKYFHPHRHAFYEIIIITEGYGTHAIDFKKYDLKKDIIYLMKPSQIHQWVLEHYNHEYDGYILYFSEELFQDSLLLNSLFHKNFNPVLHLNENIRNDIFNLIKIIEKASKEEDTLLIYHIISAILKLILTVKQDNCKKNNIDSRIFLLNEFIEKYYIQEKGAVFYANKLNLSGKRLNELTKEYLTKTITEVISDRVILEAKRELIFNNKSIKEISDKLGFIDPSYFSKFFKKQTQISPSYFQSKKSISTL
jgi:YesN/AraC family two-component response regulator